MRRTVLSFEANKEGESPHNSKLNITELAAYTSVASMLLNLDETITKE